MNEDMQKIQKFYEFAKDLKKVLENSGWSELEGAELVGVELGEFCTHMGIRQYLGGFTGELLGRKVGEFCRKYNYLEGADGVDVLGEDGGDLLFKSDDTEAGDLLADISREINLSDDDYDFWCGFNWGYRCGARLGVWPCE